MDGVTISVREYVELIRCEEVVHILLTLTENGGYIGTGDMRKILDTAIYKEGK